MAKTWKSVFGHWVCFIILGHIFVYWYMYLHEAEILISSVLMSCYNRFLQKILSAVIIFFYNTSPLLFFLKTFPKFPLNYFKIFRKFLHIQTFLCTSFEVRIPIIRRSFCTFSQFLLSFLILLWNLPEIFWKLFQQLSKFLKIFQK